MRTSSSWSAPFSAGLGWSLQVLCRSSQAWGSVGLLIFLIDGGSWSMCKGMVYSPSFCGSAPDWFAPCRQGRVSGPLLHVRPCPHFNPGPGLTWSRPAPALGSFLKSNATDERKIGVQTQSPSIFATSSCPSLQAAQCDGCVAQDAHP
jgi:hypothetical protein